MRSIGRRAVAASGVRLIAAVTLLGIGASIAGCERPPLHVRRTGSTFVIDVQTLGEYLTSVRRIRLTRRREVIWELMARNRTPQLHAFALRIGENPGVLQVCRGGGQPPACEMLVPDDRYLVIAPTGGGFQLDPGNDYDLELWGSESRWSRTSARLLP